MENGVQTHHEGVPGRIWNVDLPQGVVVVKCRSVGVEKEVSVVLNTEKSH